MQSTLNELEKLNNRLIPVKLKLFTEVQNGLRALTVAEIKSIIASSHLSALYFLFDLSVQSEDYKICDAVKQVVAERPLPDSAANAQAIC